MLSTQKKGGVVGDIISGTGMLVITVVVVLVIVSTIVGGKLLTDSDTSETITVNTESGWINESIYHLGGDVAGTGANASRSNYIILAISNDTDGIIQDANVTLDGTLGTLTNSSTNTDEFAEAVFNYTYVQTDNPYQSAADDMSTNLSGGIDNVSEKIPTILLIAAVVLLFGVLVLLVRQTSSMGLMNEGAL